MRVRVQRRNISPSELATALSGIIEQEDVADLVLSKLQKSDNHDELIPEKYIRTIADKMDETYRSVRLTMDTNVDRLLSYLTTPKKGFLKKAEDQGPTLTEEQIEELKRLIEAHFRWTVGLGWGVDQTTQKRWEKAGIVKPDDDFMEWVVKGFVAGRLADILKDTDSYARMLKLAQQLPMSRADKLALEAAKTNAAQYIKGYGRKMADAAEEVLQSRHRTMIHDVIQAYFAGDLTQTTRNDQNLLPQEVSVLNTGRVVTGWQGLSGELKNRFKAVDMSRDWDTVAQTEIRYAVNLGKFMSIQHEGGGNAENIEVYYHVQPTACKYCKKLYLNPDGTPKIFKLSELLGNITLTGGMNVGLKAGQIGSDGGWLPNAVAHPHCHCYPVRRLANYPTIPVGDLR